jgi:hypothetical protein
MGRPLRGICLLAASLLLTGCGVAFPDDSGHCVAKVAMSARLEVDLSDPKVIWGTDLTTSETISLRIPGGYGVTPDDEIIDPNSQPIGRSGDLIVSGCRDYVQDAVMIREEDLRPAD